MLTVICINELCENIGINSIHCILQHNFWHNLLKSITAIALILYWKYSYVAATCSCFAAQIKRIYQVATENTWWAFWFLISSHQVPTHSLLPYCYFAHTIYRTVLSISSFGSLSFSLPSTVFLFLFLSKLILILWISFFSFQWRSQAVSCSWP